MRYRGILLDADDTLFDFPAAEAAAFEQFLQAIELRHPDALTEYIRINTACWLDLERGVLTSDQLRIKRFSEFLSIFDHPMAPETAAETYEYLLGQQGMLLPGALEAVREIAQKRPIAIVTNGIGSVQRARLKSSPIFPYISALIISGDVGVAKPHPRMIQEALKALGMPGEPAALMVGDSLKSDVGAAVAAGIDPCWVNAAGAERPKDIEIAYEIPSIEALPPIALQE